MVKKVPKKLNTYNNNKNSQSISEYTVEKIINDRFIKKNGKIIHEFLVKWENYPNPTWEPKSNLHNCQEILNDYIKPNNINNIGKNNYYNNIKFSCNNNKVIFNNKKNKSINKPKNLINKNKKKEKITYLVPFKLEKYFFNIYEDFKNINNHNNILLYAKMYKKNLILKIIRELKFPFYITKRKILHLKININNNNLLNKVIILGFVKKKSNKIKNYINYIAKIMEKSIINWMIFDKNKY